MALDREDRFIPVRFKSCLKLFKIGANIRITVRKVWVSLSSSTPYRTLFAQVFDNLRSLKTALPPIALLTSVKLTVSYDQPRYRYVNTRQTDTQKLPKLPKLSAIFQANARQNEIAVDKAARWPLVMPDQGRVRNAG